MLVSEHIRERSASDNLPTTLPNICRSTNMSNPRHLLLLTVGFSLQVSNTALPCRSVNASLWIATRGGRTCHRTAERLDSGEGDCLFCAKRLPSIIPDRLQRKQYNPLCPVLGLFFRTIIPILCSPLNRLQCRQLQGLLAGGKAREYVPDSFLVVQHEAAYAFFSENGYLDQATAAALQVPQPPRADLAYTKIGLLIIPFLLLRLIASGVCCGINLLVWMFLSELPLSHVKQSK